MPETSRDKCSAIARSGSRCRAAVLPGRPFCFLHDPLAEPARREGARKGGRARSNAARAKKQIPEALTPEELAGGLSLLFRRLVAGQTEPRVATAAATIAKALLEVRAATEIEERLQALEEASGVGAGRRSA